MTSEVLAESSFCRSWFSATAPPSTVPAGSSLRSRLIVVPTAGLEGSWRGIAVTSDEAAAAGLGRHHLGDARVGLRDRGDPRGAQRRA